MLFFGPANRGGDREMHYGKLCGATAAAGDGEVVCEWSASMGGMIYGELAAIFFVIDAFRRKYYGNRVVAGVLALTGLLTCGVTSLLYYVVWGCRPSREG